MGDSPVLSLHAKNVPQTVRQSQMCKIKDSKIFVHTFFLWLTRRHIIFSLKNLIFSQNFVLKSLFCKHYFSRLNTFMKKGKDLEPDAYIWPMDPDPDPGGSKTWRIGSPTLIKRITLDQWVMQGEGRSDEAWDGGERWIPQQALQGGQVCCRGPSLRCPRWTQRKCITMEIKQKIVIEKSV